MSLAFQMAFQAKNKTVILFQYQQLTLPVQITPAHQLDKEDASGRLFLCQRIVELTLDRPQAA
ncbi:hypothetical protein ACIGEI_10245 [Pseudomonas sp. NPDC078863]|uniref:hypothetical protein n=1 Tax=unclassified Pseudomonas TaxID=196821 RepID=UPI0037CA1E6C